MKRKFYLLAVLSLFSLTTSVAQVTIGSNFPPDADALLDLKETTAGAAEKGLLLPRVALQDTALAEPLNANVKGMFVYNTYNSPDGKVVEGIYYNNGDRWWHVPSTTNVSELAWLTKGNAKTDTLHNFLGTTDSVALAIKVNNHLSGFVGPGKSRNTGFGYKTLTRATTIPGLDATGSANTAFGFEALNATDLGGGNTAVGTQAMAKNTSGTSNVAVGLQALHENINGIGNTAIGSEAMANKHYNHYNTAVGYSAMQSDSTGTGNTVMGYLALETSKNSQYNTVIGYDAFSSYQGKGNVPQLNTVVGSYAGTSTVRGIQNTFIGTHAGAGTAAVNDTVVKSNNTFIGAYAGSKVAGTARGNVAIGFAAAGDSASTGNIGLTTGSYNIFIGNRVATTGSITGSNLIVIGNNVSPSNPGTSNEVTIGTNGTSTAGMYRMYGAGWLTLSDRRMKSNILPIAQGLEFVKKLNPVEFIYNDGTKKNLGFVAQDVQQVMQEEGMTDYALISIMHGDTLGLNPTEIIPVLTKAIQEQQTIIETQQKAIDAQQQTLNALMLRLEALEQKQ